MTAEWRDIGDGLVRDDTSGEVVRLSDLIVQLSPGRYRKLQNLAKRRNCTAQQCIDDWIDYTVTDGGSWEHPSKR